MLLAADLAAVSDAYVDPYRHEDNSPTMIIGDVNGDGTFDPSDLVEALRAGKYNTDEPADWGEGDWNGDRQFDSGDLILAFQSGSYGSEPVAARANAVRLSPGSDGLATAIAAAGPHGTVIVEAGIHTESSSVMITHPVKILGEDGAVIEFDSDPTLAPTTPRVIDAGLHVNNTQQVTIQGLEIRDNDAGSTAILVEGSRQVAIDDNQITDFQFGVLVESADHSTLDSNVIGTSAGGLPGMVSFGVLVVNGFGNHVRDNTVSEYTFGIFVSGENGKLLNNTTHHNAVAGIMLCNLPANLQLPDGSVSGSNVPATGWLVQGNTSTNNSFGYLVIDSASRNVLTNNQGGNNSLYDIELTADSYRFGFLTPAAFDNVVNAGPYHDIEIKDCGNDNQVHGGVLLDTGVDPCF